ncbi:phosphotransferase [Paracoccaceae bacterium]
MNEPAPLGGLLAAPSPDMTEAEAVLLAEQHFGVTGTFRRLTSERDLNFHIATKADGYVLKLANRAEPAAVTDFQTRALIHLEGKGLPVPQVIRSLGGATGVDLPAGHLRLLTYLEGTPLHLTPGSAAQRRAMGQMAARLARAMADFSHPAADHVLQWDIRQAAGLRPLLPDVPADLRALAEATLDEFETIAAPALPGLRWQVVHNDLNPHNILAAPDNPDRIAGILDFGDMVRTVLVCDLAVAASYQVDPAAALTSLADFAGAWAAVYPLQPEEARLIPLLTRTRWLTTLAIASHRAARWPENAPYILRNVPAARAGLLAFADIPREMAADTLADACHERTRP